MSKVPVDVCMMQLPLPMALSRFCFQVQNALGRKEKEQTVEKLTKAFEESTAVFGMRFQNISVSD